MGLILGEDSAIQALRLLTTSSQGALFLPQMRIQTDTIVFKIFNRYDIDVNGISLV